MNFYPLQGLQLSASKSQIFSQRMMLLEACGALDFTFYFNAACTLSQC